MIAQQRSCGELGEPSADVGAVMVPTSSADTRLFGVATRLLSSHAVRPRRVLQSRTCANSHIRSRASHRGSEPHWTAHHDADAKEVVRQIYSPADPDIGLELTRPGADLLDESCPPEVNQLGRTITRWQHQIAAWHQAHVSNGPTEAASNLLKVVKRIAFGFTSFRNYRIRARRRLNTAISEASIARSDFNDLDACQPTTILE